MKHWTTAQKRYVYKHFHNKPIPQIAEDVGRSERALRLFLHRNRHDPRLLPSKNLLVQLLSKVFPDVSCFTPTRAFFLAVDIRQKRYWAVYKGREQITEEELKRIAAYFKVSLEGIYLARQTTLFEE